MAPDYVGFAEIFDPRIRDLPAATNLMRVHHIRDYRADLLLQ
jgi:hypothetical protein